MEKQSVKACSITDKFISSLVGIEGVLSVIDCVWFRIFGSHLAFLATVSVRQFSSVSVNMPIHKHALAPN